jgi:hypothetical protein
MNFFKFIKKLNGFRHFSRKYKKFWIVKNKFGKKVLWETWKNLVQGKKSQLKINLHLFGGGIPNVQQFTPQRKDPILVTTDHTEPGHHQSLGGVPFRQNEGTIGRVSRTSIVGILQFRNSLQLGSFHTTDFIQFRLKRAKKLLTELKLRIRIIAKIPWP